MIRKRRSHHYSAPLRSLKEQTLANTFRYRVLVVDDDPLLRHLGMQMFESRGYEVRCAKDGLEGLSALQRSKPDLIVSDLRMPNMSGFEFLSVVRLRFPLIPVIAISGEYAGGGIPDSVLADAFFPKMAFRPDELFERADQLINGEPVRANTGRSTRAAVWARNGRSIVAVTCANCRRSFPVKHVQKGQYQQGAIDPGTLSALPR